MNKKWQQEKKNFFKDHCTINLFIGKWKHSIWCAYFFYVSATIYELPRVQHFFFKFSNFWNKKSNNLFAVFLHEFNSGKHCKFYIIIISVFCVFYSDIFFKLKSCIRDQPTNNGKKVITSSQKEYFWHLVKISTRNKIFWQLLPTL